MRKLLFVLTIASIMLWPTLALADVVQFSGSTSGEMLGTGVSAGWWTYDPLLSFDVVTNNGGEYAFSDLGRIKLAIAGSDTVDDDVFQLTITFDLPLGIDGNPVTFDADVKGKYSKTGAFGWASLDFPDDPESFTYDNAGGSGSFKLKVYDVNQIDSGVFETITGHITSATFTQKAISDPAVIAPIPEPASIVLLGTLMSGIGLLVRRKLAR